MIQFDIEEYKLAIQGFADARIPDSQGLLRELRKQFPEVEIQLFRADRIAGPEHLLFAAMAAVRAFRQHHERSHSLAIELLLYTSCQRQISKAIQLVGVDPKSRDVILAAIARGRLPDQFDQKTEKVLKGRRDDTKFELLSSKKITDLMKVYDITAKTVRAARLSGEEVESVIKRLVVERSALLTVEKQ